jgi:flavin reductase (DIM6/NTAB) family NADH-FMN oxidoreductase RutF
MAITSEVFRAALGRFTSGVTVVTTKDREGNLHGLTVSAFCSVSLNPPLILVCIHKQTGSYHAFVEREAFVVNILSEDQAGVSNQFAYQHEDKFTGIKYREGQLGLPVLEECLVNLECRLKHSYDGGDHTIFVGEIEAATVRDAKPLAYFHGQYREVSDYSGKQ